MFSSILIIAFVSLVFMDIIQGNIITGWICITQFLKMTFTITIGLLDSLSNTRILAQPLDIALGISNEVMNPYINFAGIVGCWRVEMGVKMTDMCLSGQHVANMLADMSATQHKKLLAGVPLMLGLHVTC